MKTEIEIADAADATSPRPKIITAPSLRVPVTAGNRAFLRVLRAAESYAWEEADRNPYSRTIHWLCRPSCAA
jgi:hypothetical protein